MVLAGGRSRGCFLCKQRKIRCDEARPACRRCAVYGKPCPGYPDAYAFRVKRQQQKKAQSQSQSQPQSELQRQPGLSTIRIPTNRQDQALYFFVQQYRISARPDGAVGFLDFLSDLSHSDNNLEKTHDPLQPALDAVSNLVLYNRLRERSLYVDARKRYGAALESINAALLSETDACSDRTFAAVLLLSLFIDVAGERQGLLNQQTAGIYYLMQLRGRRNLSSNCSLSLFSWGVTHAMTQFLITGEYQCAALADLLTLAPESSHWHHAVRICGKIALFITISNPFVKSPVSHLDTNKPRQIHAFFDFALDILDEISNWYRTLPESWKHSTRDKPPSGCGMDDDIYEINPKGSWTPGYVAQFYCAEIFFYRRLEECTKRITESPLLCSLLFSLSDTKHQRLIERATSFPRRIEYVLSKLCAAVQLVFGEEKRDDENELLVSGRAGDAYMLMSPLWLTINSPVASPDQIQVCREVLQHFGAKMGLGLATTLISKYNTP